MILSIKGENNTGKTALGLSAPKPLVFFDCDPGGYKRALVTVPEEDKKLITHHLYPAPKEMLKMQLGVALPNDRVRGMKELWYRLVDDYFNAIEDDDVRTLQIDTFSQLHPNTIEAVLQEKQEGKEVGGKLPPNKEYPESLGTYDHKWVNQRLRALIEAAFNADKHLILVHHMEAVWGKILNEKGALIDGVIGRDAKGWKKVGMAAIDLAGIAVEMKQKNKKIAGGGTIVTFETTFIKSPPALMNQTLENAVFEDINTRVEMLS